MENAGRVLVGLLALGAMIEGVVELLVGSWIGKVRGFVHPDQAWKRELVLKFSSAVVGIVGCLIFGLDLVGVTLSAFGVAPAMAGPAMYFGQVMSGILLGRGAQWLHDFGSRWIGLDDSG